MTFHDKFWQSYSNSCHEYESIQKMSPFTCYQLSLFYPWSCTMSGFFPHKTTNYIIGAKIMQEFSLLFSLPLIILMVVEKNNCIP